MKHNIQTIVNVINNSLNHKYDKMFSTQQHVNDKKAELKYSYLHQLLKIYSGFGKYHLDFRTKCLGLKTFQPENLDYLHQLDVLFNLNFVNILTYKIKPTGKHHNFLTKNFGNHGIKVAVNAGITRFGTTFINKILGSNKKKVGVLHNCSLLGSIFLIILLVALAVFSIMHTLCVVLLSILLTLLVLDVVALFIMFIQKQNLVSKAINSINLNDLKHYLEKVARTTDLNNGNKMTNKQIGNLYNLFES